MDDTKIPPTGSFPGFALGTELFSAWTDSMLQQARTWNRVWSKMREGTYEMKDWYATLAESFDVGSATFERIMRGLSGPGSPPWVTLPWPPANAVEVRIQSPLEPNESLTASALCPLGEAAKVGKSLEVFVKPVSAYVLKVWIDPHTKAEPGQYIGFVFAGKNTTPAAVTQLTVSKNK
jgi:hypothetical protein